MALRWLPETLPTPYGPTVEVLSWSVAIDDAIDDADDLPELDDAQDQLGAVMWNSNKVVLDYLHEHVYKGTLPSEFGGVLELGAGVGALGIALAVGGAPVVLTDIKELVPLMSLNARRNRYLASQSKSSSSSSSASPPEPYRCLATAWKWGEKIPKPLVQFFRKHGGISLVLLCDALYGNPKEWPKLIETLDTIVEYFGHNVRVYNFCEQRVQSVEDAFIELISKNPLWKSTKTQEVDAQSELGMTVRVTRLLKKKSTDEEDRTASAVADAVQKLTTDDTQSRKRPRSTE